MRSIDIWESASTSNFVQDKLIPAIAEVNPDARRLRSPNPGDIRPTTGLNRIDPLPRHKEEKKWQFSWSWSFR